MKPMIEAFFDPTTRTISYVVYDQVGGHAAIIDPVLDYDPKSAHIQTGGADRIQNFIRIHQLKVQWILETHAHADHLSAASYLQQQMGGKIAMGEKIKQVQTAFKKIFNFGEELATNGSQFDYLFAEDEVFQIGQLTAQALFVPGHTPADMAYQIADAVFVGDTLFMPDVGTARCDFPGGNANTMYQSIQKLYALSDSTRLFMCHDYPPAARTTIKWETTVANQKKHNIHIHQGISEEQFVAMRNQRDATLEMPTLILPSIQINIRAGGLPPPETNGTSYLKIPLNTF